MSGSRMSKAIRTRKWSRHERIVEGYEFYISPNIGEEKFYMIRFILICSFLSPKYNNLSAYS